MSKFLKPVDKYEAITPKDRSLIRFIVANSKKYDRCEVFLRAQEQVPSLAQDNVLDLYLRYHRVLYPLITGKLSNECLDSYDFRRGGDKMNHVEAEETFQKIEKEEIEEIPIARQLSLGNNHVNDQKEEVNEIKKSKSADDTNPTRNRLCFS